MEILLGVGVSALVQFVKIKYGTKEYPTLLILAGVAVGAAFLFQFLVGAGYWELLKKILVTAGAFYAFIIKRFQIT